MVRMYSSICQKATTPQASFYPPKARISLLPLRPPISRWKAHYLLMPTLSKYRPPGPAQIHQLQQTISRTNSGQNDSQLAHAIELTASVQLSPPILLNESELRLA